MIFKSTTVGLLQPVIFGMLQITSMQTAFLLLLADQSSFNVIRIDDDEREI